MKKAFIAFVALILISASLSAQKTVKVRFGVEAGFNLTKWNGDFLPNYELEIPSSAADIEDAGFNPGFHIGGLADLMITEKWTIQPELLLSYEGTKANDVKVTAMYIKVPVLVYYKFHNVGPGTLYPGLGFFFAGAVGGKVDGETNTFGDEGIMDEFDWGLNVKVTYEMSKFVNGMFASLGFSQGLTTSKTLGLGLSVGYKFAYCKFLKRAYNTGILEYNP